MDGVANGPEKQDGPRSPGVLLLVTELQHDKKRNAKRKTKMGVFRPRRLAQHGVWAVDLLVLSWLIRGSR